MLSMTGWVTSEAGSGSRTSEPSHTPRSFTVTFFATKTLSGQPLGFAQGSADGVAPGQTVTETLVSQNPMFSQSNFYYEFQVDTEF